MDVLVEMPVVVGELPTVEWPSGAVDACFTKLTVRAGVVTDLSRDGCAPAFAPPTDPLRTLGFESRDDEVRVVDAVLEPPEGGGSATWRLRPAVIGPRTWDVAPASPKVAFGTRCVARLAFTAERATPVVADECPKPMTAAIERAVRAASWTVSRQVPVEGTTFHGDVAFQWIPYPGNTDRGWLAVERSGPRPREGFGSAVLSVVPVTDGTDFTMWIRGRVDERGVLDAVTVEGCPAACDVDAVAAAARSWPFWPHFQDGAPVAADFETKVRIRRAP